MRGKCYQKEPTCLFPLRYYAVPKHYTVFEYPPKVAFSILQFWHFPPIFVLLKLTCLVTLFYTKRQFFKKSPKLTIFGIFNELLVARNFECDFLGGFQTLCLFSDYLQALFELPA